MPKYGRVYTGKVGGAAGRLAAAGLGFALAEDRAAAGIIHEQTIVFSNASFPFWYPLSWVSI